MFYNASMIFLTIILDNSQFDFEEKSPKNNKINITRNAKRKFSQNKVTDSDDRAETKINSSSNKSLKIEGD